MSAGIKPSFFISPLQLKCDKSRLALTADDPHPSRSGPKPKESTKTSVRSLTTDSVLTLFANFFLLFVELLKLQERKALIKQSLFHCFTLPQEDLWLSNVPRELSSYSALVFFFTEDEDTLISCSAANMTEKKQQ